MSLMRETPARPVAEGVAHLRPTPQAAADMVAVAQVFRDAPDGRVSAAEADARLAAPSGDAGLSDGFHHGAAGYRRIAAAAPG